VSSGVQNRLVSSDIFRGVTIGGMIVVNNLQSWSDIPSRFPRLVHAEWNGCTLADLIYPLFIFIVGVTTAISLGQRPPSGGEKSTFFRWQP
jgi:predicted acyltransferase